MRGLTLSLIVALGLGVAQTETTTNSPPSNNLGPAFRTACWHGDLNKATLLLNEGAPIEGRDKLGRTPLFLAAHGAPDIVELLLAHGANIEAASNNGDTPICRACGFGNLASAQMLLAAGANMNVVNKYGYTPLILAARGGHDALVSLLIAHHVDVNYESIGSPALCFAIGNDHLSTAKLLLEAGANPNALSKPDDPKKFGHTMLSWAATSPDAALIDLLLAHGADINGKSEDGTTPLMYAAIAERPENVEFLRNKGAGVDLQDNSGETALIYGIVHNQQPIWQDLVQSGAKLELRDKKGSTALMVACLFDNFPAVQFLVDHGADIEAQDLLGNRPLTYAASRGDAEVERLLEDKGAGRVDVHVLVQQKPTPPLQPAQSWALACGAIYAMTNGCNPEVLGYENRMPAEAMQKRLKEDWGITDKLSFIKMIDNLNIKGQRTSYQFGGAKLAALSDEDFEKKLEAVPLMAAKLKAARKSYIKWKEKSGLAWDLCRCANLINFGYDAHYLDEDEAWQRLLSNALLVQDSFTSWQEMSDNFLDGREIWAGQRDPKFEACSQLLLNANDPHSPWNENSWATNLSANAF